MAEVTPRPDTGPVILRDKIDPLVASYVGYAEQELSKVIHDQFRVICITAALAAGLLLLVIFGAARLARSTPNAELMDRLEESNRNLSAVSQALLQPSPNVTATTRALDVVLRQAELHQAAVQELRNAQQQVTPEAQSFVQILGSSAILALLGVLGFQRLQNIDSEINNVRNSMFAQIEARSRDTAKVLSAALTETVEERFKKAEQDFRTLEKQQTDIGAGLRQQAAATLADVRQQVEAVKGELAQVRGLLDEYPWLKSRERVDQALLISQLSSVEQAHRLAVRFNQSNDIFSAREALHQIVAKSLPGSPDDFHNAHVEAMRMDEVTLALEIADAGLKSFPDQYDLMADRISALRSLGRVEEARQLIEDWKVRKPDEFTRGWRPAVFYVDLFRGLDLTPEATASIEAALKDVTAKLPLIIKPWSAYARFLKDRGRVEEAERVLRQALEFNPFSQELNYVLGELLLAQGKAKDALECLEKALRIDYQEQFEHDVNQYAVWATLAQAYEACGEYNKALLLYQSIAADPSPKAEMLKEYAASRRAAIAILKGELPPREEQPADVSARLLQLLQSAAEKGPSPDGSDAEPTTTEPRA